MGKSKAGVDDNLNELHFFGGGDDEDFEDSLLQAVDLEGGEAARRLPAWQRLEMRNEQRSLREQLSDWEDYDSDDLLAGL